MKLGIKMFFCITVFFSAAFLVCGAALISYFYETAVEKEIESTAQRYQHNKFVIQAALITREHNWAADTADGSGDMTAIASDLDGTAALFSSDGSLLFSGFGDGTDLSSLPAQAASEKVSWQFMEIRHRMYLLIFGNVTQADTCICLVTGTDINKILLQQEQILKKFGCIYAVSLSAGIVLITGLSLFLTRPLKQLTAAAQKIADGSYEERVAEFGNDEAGQLARSFNQMACAIEEKIQELSESARQKEDFTANFAHELKTPLTSIIGYADRIYQKELPRESQKQAAWRIWNEGMRLEALSLKLMDLTVLNHKEFILQEMRADTLLQELADDAAYLMHEKNIDFECIAQKAYIKADYDLFKTLFLNLLDNAAKAGASQIQVHGQLTATNEAIQYTISIKDNGCGIPPDEIRKITEAFYMVDKSRSRKQHGAGLGLALAQKIAKIHGSSLVFESDGANGACVYLQLPAVPYD